VFIYEKIWEAKKIKNEDTKVLQLEITFIDLTLYWYMGLSTNKPRGTPTTIAYVKR
jgi:hypothetical protein